MRIVLCYPVERRHVQRIEAAAPDAEVVDAGQEGVAAELPTADIFCGHAKVPVPWDEVVARGRLQWIQSSAAGVDHCLVPSVRKSAIPVASASGVLADQVAEHTLAILGALLRRLPTFHDAKANREYIRRPTLDLHRATVGIVGLGGNGRRIAELLRPYRATILATDWFPVDKPPTVDELHPADALDELLPRLDVLILAAPLTSATQNMIGADQLARLPKGAVLINVARGGMVVEPDLARALDSGHLGGAGLDVAATEPLPDDSPLWDFPNVVITPHVGGQSAWRIDSMTDLFCENLRRAFRGEPLLNIVDKALGFPRPENRYRPGSIGRAEAISRGSSRRVAGRPRTMESPSLPSDGSGQTPEDWEEMTTTLWREERTISFGGSEPAAECPDDLLRQYHDLVGQRRLAWTEHLGLDRLLGSGGQGVVYFSQRRGADFFTLPVALKIFSPEHYDDERAYLNAMARVGQVACHVARIQHDNLIDVQNFIERFRIRVMEMEWIDGYDLARLMTAEMLKKIRGKVSQKRWEYINDVIVTMGESQPRLKPGIAIAIVRECLRGLAALHREEIVHGDIKPSNIMIKRTGHAKIIDVGSAMELNELPDRLMCTPVFAAPETLDRSEITPRSDLASLGYVLIELLAGRPLFAGSRGRSELLEAKRRLAQRLEDILPPEVVDSEQLMTICRRLTAADPMLRFDTADEADTDYDGMAEFQRTLVKGDLASEADHDLRVWLEELD